MLFRSLADLYQRAIDIIIARRGPDHPDVARGYGQLGVLYLDLGQFERAEEMLVRTQAIFAANFDPASSEMATANAYLAKVYNARGRHADAEVLLRRVVAVREAQLAPDNLLLLEAADDLMVSLKAQGKESEAAEVESRYDFAPYHATLAKFAEEAAQE